MSNAIQHLFGNDQLLIIAGPCVIESRDMTLRVAETLKKVCDDKRVNFVFKSSFDKANRTSTNSYRGPGVQKGLEILSEVKNTLGVKVLTDVHEDTPLSEVAEVVDVMQTPAFLVRQTNFIQNVARQGIPVNVKKGQFQAPWDMAPVLAKCREVGNEHIMLCDRGTSFGYNTLISDMRGLPIMRNMGAPVIFDATHSVQQPGGQGTTSGGQREFVPVLARSAVAAGVSGVFMETHPNPPEALSDGPNMLPLEKMAGLIDTLVAINDVVREQGFLENELS